MDIFENNYNAWHMKNLMLTLIFIVGLAFNDVSAQILDPVKWQFGSKRLSEKEAVIFIKATIDNGWHLYSQHVAADGPQATKFTFIPSDAFTLLGKTAEPKAKTTFENVFKMDVAYFDSEVVFQQRIKLADGKPTVKGNVMYQVCNDTECIPGEKNFSVIVN